MVTDEMLDHDFQLWTVHPVWTAELPLSVRCDFSTDAGVHRQQYDRRWRKVRLVVRLVHKLVASWHLYKSQIL